MYVPYNFIAFKKKSFHKPEKRQEFWNSGLGFRGIFCKTFSSQRHIWVLSFLTSKGPLQLPNPISSVITLFLLTIKNFWKIIAPFATQRLPWEKRSRNRESRFFSTWVQKSAWRQQKNVLEMSTYSHLDNFLKLISLKV